MNRALPSLLVLLPLISGCMILPWGKGHSEVFENVSFDDVFEIAAAQIDRDYEIAKANRETGVIESTWDFDAVSEVTRLLRRDKVVADVIAVKSGVKLRVRVRTQVRERTGLLTPDDRSGVGWTDSDDDDELAARLFELVRAVLMTGRPSPEFESRRSYDERFEEEQQE